MRAELCLSFGTGTCLEPFLEFAVALRNTSFAKGSVETEGQTLYRRTYVSVEDFDDPKETTFLIDCKMKLTGYFSRRHRGIL